MKFKKFTNGVITVKKDYSKNLLLSLSELSAYPGHAVQTVSIPPHTKQRNHFHFTQTEIAYVLSGSASYYINGKEYKMGPGDIIVDEPNEQHFIDNTSSSDFIVLVFKINMPSENDDTSWLEK